MDKSTEENYDDKFWDALDGSLQFLSVFFSAWFATAGVTTALDNIAARKYVDERCVYFQVLARLTDSSC